MDDVDTVGEFDLSEDARPRPCRLDQDGDLGVWLEPRGRGQGQVTTTTGHWDRRRGRPDPADEVIVVDHGQPEAGA